MCGPGALAFDVKLEVHILKLGALHFSTTGWSCNSTSLLRWSCKYIEILCRGWGRDIRMGCSKLCFGDSWRWFKWHHWDYWTWWGFCSGSVSCIALRNQSSSSKICWVLTVLLFLIKQVTLVTSEPVPVEFSHVLKFGDVSYNLYSHSFLQLGLVSCVRKY